MSRKNRLISLIVLSVLIASSAALAEDREAIVLTRVTSPSGDAFARPTFMTYHDTSGRNWITVFKFRGVSVNNGLGDVNGPWSIDTPNGDIRLTRFDNSDRYMISLFSTPGIEGYLIGYRLQDAEGNPEWHFMGPGEALPWDLTTGKYEIQIVDETAIQSSLTADVVAVSR